MTTKHEERRTIKIRASTHEKLKKKAIYGETMDCVINRCMFEENNKSSDTKTDKKIKRLL